MMCTRAATGPSLSGVTKDQIGEIGGEMDVRCLANF
jgi:hypothetical protein